MMSIVENKWIRRYCTPEAQLRLFCLPYAGGTARAFRDWDDWLKPNIEMVVLEPPGRGRHLDERPIERVELMTESLSKIMEDLFDMPFAIFGHGVGSIVGYELCRALRKKDLCPIHLYVSSMLAPHEMKQARVLYSVSNSIPLLEGMLLTDSPILEADLRLIETYEYREGLKLNHPITVFAAASDTSFPCESLEAWKLHTAKTCFIRLLPKRDLFAKNETHIIAAAIAASLLRPELTDYDFKIARRSQC